jgi:hypothetical protein
MVEGLDAIAHLLERVFKLIVEGAFLPRAFSGVIPGTV